MKHAINSEVPDSNRSLISVCIDPIWVLDLVCDQLMSFAPFELHLFFEELVLVSMLSSLCVFVFGISSFSGALLFKLFIGHALHEHHLLWFIDLSTSHLPCWIWHPWLPIIWLLLSWLRNQWLSSFCNFLSQRSRLLMRHVFLHVVLILRYRIEKL